jgi:hypothetical protein
VVAQQEIVDVGAGVPRVRLFGHEKDAYFFSPFFADSSDFFELSDLRELSDRWESSDFDELSAFEESSDFLPSFFDAESPLEELEEEEGAEDFLA